MSLMVLTLGLLTASPGEQLALESARNVAVAEASPRAALELADSYERRGERARAAYYYRLYMRRAPAAQDRLLIAEKVGEFLFSEQAHGRGLLEVESPGATQASVDGHIYSTLPIALFLPSGEHDLEVTYKNQTQRRRVAIYTGRATSVVMEPKAELVASYVRPANDASDDRQTRKPQAKSRGWVLIAHRAMRTEIREDSLRALFTGEHVVSEDGQVAQVVLGPAGSPARAAFLAEFLGQNEGSFQAARTRMVFRGDGTVPPLVLGSEAEVVRVVSTRPGTFGIVPDNVPLSGVTRVEIQGR
jgi:hypothetical protein